MVLCFEETAFSRQMVINKKGKESRGENRLGLLNRGQVFVCLFNKLNTNNLLAIVNID